MSQIQGEDLKPRVKEVLSECSLGSSGVDADDHSHSSIDMEEAERVGGEFTQKPFTAYNKSASSRSGVGGSPGGGWDPTERMEPANHLHAQNPRPRTPRALDRFDPRL